MKQMTQKVSLFQREMCFSIQLLLRASMMGILLPNASNTPSLLPMTQLEDKRVETVNVIHSRSQRKVVQHHRAQSDLATS